MGGGLGKARRAEGRGRREDEMRLMGGDPGFGNACVHEKCTDGTCTCIDSTQRSFVVCMSIVKPTSSKLTRKLLRTAPSLLA